MRRICCVGLLLAGCATNPYTGRKQLLLLDEKQEAKLGSEGYQEVLAAENLSHDPRETAPVRRVGQRIAAAANRPDFEWEFNVILDDFTVNAWCMPGGKIAFYTGIYPALKDEAGMAFVMGHEVSHALLRHGAERISQNMAAEAVGGLLAAGIGGKDAQKQALVLGAFGVAAGVGVLLPFSRKHESEADALGLKLMAQAGYDPRAGVEVWKRMESMGGGQGTPEFLSTHPSHETRIKDLEAGMAEALAIYGKAPKAAHAELPPIDKRKGAPKNKDGVAAFAPGDGTSVNVDLQKGPARRGRMEDGRAAIEFQFAFSRPAYLRDIRISGPAGPAGVEAKTGIAGGDRKSVTLYRPDKGASEFPPGRYILTFIGAVNGSGFQRSVTYEVP
ncbi:MAG TPA: M48 family metallopeptidase [Planctomycetota bacterium]